MRLVVVLVLLVNIASAQVHLPDSVARFFLERHDFANFLEKKQVVYEQLRTSYEAEIKSKDLVIESYSKDYNTHTKMIENLNQQLNLYEQQNKMLVRKFRKERLKQGLFLAGGALLALFL